MTLPSKRIHLGVIVLVAVVASLANAEKKQGADTGTPLPEAIASFGAVANDGWVYVYSGHIGKAHDHSKDNLSQSFRRRKLSGGEWEDLPMETPLQGLALVAHDGRVYRVGGMTAKNSAEEDANLFSLDSFARFDPETKSWTQLAPLPQGRSSHDAVVIDGKIYVVGGWALKGESDEGEWSTDILIFDPAKETEGWRTVKQPFERRALAATHRDGKLFVIGGMNAYHEIDRSVDVYDPANDEWSKGPDLPGVMLNGYIQRSRNWPAVAWLKSNSYNSPRATEGGNSATTITETKRNLVLSNSRCTCEELLPSD